MKKKALSTQTKFRGFTLVETSVATFLIIILGIGILGLQVFLGNLQLASIKSFTNVEPTSYALNQMEKELRTARTGENGAFLIESALSDSITFYSDYDADTVVEKINYTRSGTNLVKSIIEPTGYPATYPPGSAKNFTLSTSVRNGTTPLFYYYNGNWPGDTVNNPLATPANLAQVKMVRIYLSINATATDSKNNFILDTSVSLRTVKDNL